MTLTAVTMDDNFTKNVKRFRDAGIRNAVTEYLLFLGYRYRFGIVVHLESKMIALDCQGILNRVTRWRIRKKLLRYEKIMEGVSV